MKIEDLLRQVEPFAHKAPSESLRECFAAAKLLLGGEIPFQWYRDLLSRGNFPFRPIDKNDLLVKHTIDAVDCYWRLENGWYATGVARRHARGIIHQAEKELTSIIK